MATKSKRSSLSLTKLKSANAKLEAENKALKKKLKTTPKKQSSEWFASSWRAIVVTILIGLSAAILFVGNIFFWAGNTVTNTDRYIQTIEPLIKQPEIQQAIASYTTTQIFNNVNVTEAAEDVLPPKASFLAEPLAQNLQAYTEKTLQKFVASQQFQDIWIEAHTRAHSRLIAIATNYEGDGTIDLNYLYQQLSKRLVNTKLSFLADKQLPSNIGSITVVEAQWLPAFHNLVTNIGLWQVMATAFFLILAALAIWLSKNKRRTLIVTGWTFAAVMLLTLISIRVTKSIVVDSISETYQAAASSAYQIVFHQLVLNTTTILLLSLLIVITAWLSGQTAVAISVRSRFSLLFAGKLHNSVFGGHENRLTTWFGRHKRALQWLSLVLVAIIMLLVRLTPLAVLGYGLLWLLLLLVIELVASSDTNASKRKNH